MTDEEKALAAADAAKKDAATASECTPEKVLSVLDAISKKLDATSGRMDAMEDLEKQDKAKKDAAKAAKDAQAKKDAEAKADEAAKADAQAKKDAEEEEFKKKEMEEKDSAKKDALVLAKKVEEQDRVIRELMNRIPMRTTDPDYGEVAKVQTRFDAVFSRFGQRADRPLSGETALTYRQRLLSELKAYSPACKDDNIYKLDGNPLDLEEKQIFHDAMAASERVDHLDEDELHEVRVPMGSTGHTATEFRGRRSFIHALKRPALRVTRFNTDRE